MIPLVETALGSLLKGIVDRFFPNTSELKKQEIIAQMARELQDSELLKGQLTINVEEAKNPDRFVSGWRPFIGWVCGLAFAWQYFVCPILTFLIVAAGNPAPAIPDLGVETMMPVLMGMLGLAGYRSFEKYKKVN